MEKIAIIGLSCLFPGADGPNRYWKVLTRGQNTTSNATTAQLGVNPAAFYDPTRTNLDSSYNLRGGYVSQFRFDPNGYALPEALLAALDNVYQWSLHVARSALEDSGYLEDATVRARTGIILGNLCFPTRNSNRLYIPVYDTLLNQAVNDLLQNDRFALPELAPPGHMEDGYSPGYPAAVIAAALGLGGTHFALDAACASSLYSLGLACKYLATGRADLMLAGAVSAADPLYVNIGFAHLGGYPDPQQGQASRPLDATSGGLTSGEGAGMFVLKRHADALRDGDHIYALVSGVGLSNDGRGKHILIPNSKGQILALKRAYEDAGLSPDEVDYVECHASGTPLGDKTELNSMEIFFSGAHKPKIGSVKSNVGHLLTAAGMSSMVKLILGMAYEQLPATIGVQTPLSSLHGAFSGEQIVTELEAWPKNGNTRRVGINAFGFGGVSAHVILEADENQPAPQQSPPSPPHRLSMAITGMDVIAGPLHDLDSFARAIYKGDTVFGPVPEQRWKGIQNHPEILSHFGLPNGESPDGAYISEFDIDFLHFGIPPNPDDMPISQQLLLLRVADNAIRDAGLNTGDNVAVLVAVGTELALHRYRGRADLNWQVEQALSDAGITLSQEQTEELKRITKDALLSPAKANHYISYIGNITASRVSAQWDFAGPSFTISAEENSVYKALEVAQLLLANDQIDAVLVGAVDLPGGPESVFLRNTRAPMHYGQPVAGFDTASTGWMVGDAAGAVILTREDRVDAEKVYATIDAVAMVQETAHTGEFPGAPSAKTVAQAAQTALSNAGIAPETVGYLEFHGSGIPEEDSAEIAGIASIYRGDAPRCAVGTVKANTGHSYAASGMVSLIKTALCISQRFLPAVPNWGGPEQPDLWQGTPFFAAPQSRTWFDDKRIAAMSGLGVDGTAAHIIVSSAEQPTQDNGSLDGEAPYLLPLAASDVTTLDFILSELLALLDVTDLATLADEVYSEFAHIIRHNTPAFTLSLVGRNEDEIRRQIEQARSGVPKAVANRGVWSTPAGSYFTANPVGTDGDIAFVYPGAFNSYPKMGYDLLYLFPETFDALQAVKANVGEAVAEHRLYPRSLDKAGAKLTRSMKNALLDDPVAMVESGLSFALLYTRAMRDVFDIHPNSAFGYSLGEGSMMWGMSVWNDGDSGSEALHVSPLFTRRLAGAMEAVREAWGIPEDVPTDEFWAAYFIAGAVDSVRAAVAQEGRVYLTHINTPNECMIAGDPAACQHVVDSLGFENMKAPFSVVIHTEAMMSEYGEFRDLHDLPVTQIQEDITFYSAADYAPVKLEQAVIANNISRMACKQIDFPRLIERAYADGARVFIELGPRSTCARWIDETLGDRDHIAVSIDQMGIDDRTAIVRMLAQLASHHVPMDLSPLYRPIAQDDSRKQLIRPVSLGGEDIYATITTEENRTLFASIAVDERTSAPKSAPDLIPDIQISTPTMTAVPPPSKLTAMPENLSTVHVDFLKSRQDALQQIGDIIEMQIGQLHSAESQYSDSQALPQTPALPPPPFPSPAPAPSVVQGITPLYATDMVCEFATGRVANCFGDRYTIYDDVRAPRIPNSSLLLMTRVISIEGERFNCQPGTSIHTEYDVPVDAWFYRDNAYPYMPYSVYMEIALQPCGFLSAYHGPTLDYPDTDFYFRNLDGQGKLYKDVDMRGRTITNHVTLTSSTSMSGIIIQKFTFALYDGDFLFYEGDAAFGYFTLEALDSQAGLDLGKDVPRWIDTVDLNPQNIIKVDPHREVGSNYLRLSHGMLEFTDEIKIVPDGGTYSKGYAYANTIIDPAAWFFSCHFYQDPVMPGSIGVETIMQALQAFAIETGLADELASPHFAQTSNHNVVWKYRGQILSDSEKSHVEANIKHIERANGQITIYADASLWRDTLRIYEVTDIALMIIEA